MSAEGVNVAGAERARQADVVLGEDWIGPDAAAESEARAKRDRRGVIAMNRSPLARKIITFNLLAILVLVAGVLFLNAFRDSLVLQRERALIIETEQVKALFEARLQDNLTLAGQGLKQPEAERVLSDLDIPMSADIFIFDAGGRLLGTTRGQPRVPSLADQIAPDAPATMISDFLDSVWGAIATVFGRSLDEDTDPTAPETAVAGLVATAMAQGTQSQTIEDFSGNTVFAVATPLSHADFPVGVLAVASAAGSGWSHSKVTSCGTYVKNGSVVSSIVNVADVLDSFPHSSVAVNSTVADPVAPQSSDNPEKLLLQVTSPQISEAVAPPLLANQSANS